jgi:hypothetical protein
MVHRRVRTIAMKNGQSMVAQEILKEVAPWHYTPKKTPSYLQQKMAQL